MYKRVHLLSAADGASKRQLPFPDWVNCCGFGDNVVLAAGDAAEVVVWNLDDDSEPQAVTHAASKKTDSVLSMALRGNLLVTGDNDCRLNAWTDFEAPRALEGLSGWAGVPSGVLCLDARRGS